MVIGTLCDQITYPHRLEPQERTFEVEEKLRTLLQKVGVRYFVLGLTDLPAAYAYDNIFSKSCCRRRRRRHCCCELAANWLRTGYDWWYYRSNTFWRVGCDVSQL